MFLYWCSCLFFCFVSSCFSFFFFDDTATTEIYTLSLHDALPITSKIHFIHLYYVNEPTYFNRISFSDPFYSIPDGVKLYGGEYSYYWTKFWGFVGALCFRNKRGHDNHFTLFDFGLVGNAYFRRRQ